MKRIFAFLLACSALTLTMFGCSDKESSSDEKSESSSSVLESSDDSSAEASEEESEKASSPEGPATLEAGQIDENLIGEWYSSEMNGSFCFDETSRVLMSTDYAVVLYFNEDCTPVFYDVIEGTSEYDGTKLSVFIDSSEFDFVGGDSDGEVMEMLELERVDSADIDSIDGKYEVTGGVIYEELIELIFSGNKDIDIFADINGSEFVMKMDICEYTADGERIELFGDSVELFSTSREDSVMSYTISGDILTMTDAAGESMEFKKQ